VPPKNRTDTWRTGFGVTFQGSVANTTSPRDYIDCSANGSQNLLTSFGHEYQKLGKTRADIGGKFSCVRRELVESNSASVWNRTVGPTSDGNASAYNYQGRYYAKECHVTDADFPSPVFPNDPELDNMGATAIARIIPTNPLVDVSVTLGEMRSEGIPSLVGSDFFKHRASVARSAGKEYLNVEFGWKPLVSDVQAFAHSVLHWEDLVEKYENESGRLLHRRYTFPTTVSTTNTVTASQRPSPTIHTGFFNGGGDLSRTESIRTETWFAGAFTYYLDPGLTGKGKRERNRQLAKKLLGVQLTPEVLWNLSPWSWAADWFANTGDILHNISAFKDDGLVMPYAYIMRKRTHSVEWQLSKLELRRLGTYPGVSQRFTTTVKSRHKATPWGFGLNPLSFTVRQWAITTALGLSKSHGEMR
jgi:hypothetical protein